MNSKQLLEKMKGIGFEESKLKRKLQSFLKENQNFYLYGRCVSCGRDDPHIPHEIEVVPYKDGSYSVFCKGLEGNGLKIEAREEKNLGGSTLFKGKFVFDF